MVDIRRIVCPVDLSSASRHALAHARALAHWYRAHLTILHVAGLAVPPVPIGGISGELPILPAIPPEDFVSEVYRFSAEARGGQRDDDVTDREEVTVIDGSPARAIVAHAEAHGSDLLVLGTHGRGGFEHLLIGSVAEKVLRTTGVPVLTVPPPAGDPGPVLYRTILCPIEFSQASTRALEYALSLAEETDARLILLHVIEGSVENASGSDAYQLTVEEHYHRLGRTAMERLRAAVPDEARVWCKPHEIVATGKAYREILRVADEEGAEVIVMGVHGQGVLHRRLFGSTTHHVIREGRWPVLTLRA